MSCAISVASAEANELVVVLTENFFRSYRGPSQEYVAVVKLSGGSDPQTISLGLDDFQNSAGGALATWNDIDILTLRAYLERNQTLLGSKSWVGDPPVFRKISWTGLAR